MKLSIWRTFIGLFMVILGIALFARYSGIIPGIDSYWSLIIVAMAAFGGLAFIVTLILDRSQWWAAIPGAALLGLAGMIFLSSWTNIPADLTAAVFVAGIGLGFMLVFILRREYWWALIPCMVMLGISVMMVLNGLASLTQWSIPGQVSAAVFLGFIGLGFAAVYFTHRESWWPVIPAGALISVALVVATGSVGSLFLGLGITFGLLSLLPSTGGRMLWPLIPGASLFLLGLLFVIGKGMWGNYIFPSLLILAGLYLVARNLLGKHTEEGS